MRPLWASWAIAGASPRSSQATASRSSSTVIIGSHQLWFAFERHQGLGHVVAQVRRVEGADYDTVYTGLSEKKVQAGLHGVCILGRIGAQVATGQSFLDENTRDRKSTRLNSSHVAISY